MPANLLTEPFQGLDELRQAVDRIFGRFFDGDGLRDWRWPFSRIAFLPGLAATTYPLLNIADDRDNVYVEALAPGLDPESLEVSIVDNRLRIAGEKPSITPEIRPEAFHRNERSAGRFVRTVTLPVPVETDGVTATYENGLLLIRMPKVEKAKPKQIAVSTD